MQKRFVGSMQVQKGFAFTIDAAVAALILLSFISAITYVPLAETGGNERLHAGRVMDDALAVLGRRGILETLDQNFITSELGAVMPEKYAWRLRVERYTYDPSTETFLLANAVDFNRSIDMSGELVHGRRLFVTVSGRDAQYYNNLEYWTGLRKWYE